MIIRKHCVRCALRRPTIIVFDVDVAFLFDDLAVSVTLTAGFFVVEVATPESLSTQPATAARVPWRLR
ncbi:hypothetical protein G3M48_001375 [Beauveria asiatica]|uniref:Uncharacterized protein n=1 Tax=Beauveria asiatica TaxID=1069075 RepID=A0AAW0RZ66_9HYPO